ncbi:MAG: class I SAM-dependent methyltransferase, partial [Betaproteobacteria bacterium]|nr:class I SAM-dependent methyltransferase [Betaproteobacteria bacterium]
YKPFYKLSYLVGAKKCGLLDILSDGPQTFDNLANAYCQDAKAREALHAWLQFGISLGFLSLKDNRYFLKGLALKMSLPENDATLALAQEVATLHHKLILDTPIKLRSKTLWQLEDQDSELTARSSRALEVFLDTAIDKFFPKSGKVQLLEVGCGSACYIHHAATRNPSLHALGLELQSDVAEVARSNIQKWGLTERIAIEVGDIRNRAPTQEFDIVTLYNNIYYFRFDERIALLRHLKKFIKPSGFLLLTTCCQGGNLSIEALNLWGAATEAGGRLPSVMEMQEQLTEAGYKNIHAIRLIPGDSFYAFRVCASDRG